MSSIPGTAVNACIVPADSEDDYPTHKALYGQGGYRSVDTIADRDAITLDRREEGMLVYVAETGLIYKLAADLDSWDAGISADQLAAAYPSAAIGLKVAVPASSSGAGQPGYWAADTGFLYIYLGDGTTHSWRRTALSAY